MGNIKIFYNNDEGRGIIFSNNTKDLDIRLENKDHSLMITTPSGFTVFVEGDDKIEIYSKSTKFIDKIDLNDLTKSTKCGVQDNG